MSITRTVGLALALATSVLGAPASSQACWFGHHGAATTYRPVIAGSPVIATPVCNTCQRPAVAYYAPQVAYAPVMAAPACNACQAQPTAAYYAPAYAPSYAPASGCSTCNRQPVAAYYAPAYSASYVPYAASYVPYAASYVPYAASYAPAAAGCSTCNQQPAIAYSPIAPIASGCSTCGQAAMPVMPAMPAAPASECCGAGQPAYAPAPVMAPSTPSPSLMVVPPTGSETPTPALPNNGGSGERTFNRPTEQPNLAPAPDDSTKSLRPVTPEEQNELQPIPSTGTQNKASGLFRAPETRDPQDRSTMNQYRAPVHQAVLQQTRKLSQQEQEDIEAASWKPSAR